MGKESNEPNESTLKAVTRSSPTNESWKEIARNSQAGSINRTHGDLHSAHLASQNAGQPGLSTDLPKIHLSPAQLKELKADIQKLHHLGDGIPLKPGEQIKSGLQSKSAAHPDYVDFGAPIDRYLDSIRPGWNEESNGGKPRDSAGSSEVPSASRPPAPLIGENEIAMPRPQFVRPHDVLRRLPPSDR